MGVDQVLDKDFGKSREMVVEELRRQGTEKLANTIEEVSPEKLANETYIDALIDQYPGHKSDINEIHNQARKTLDPDEDTADFDITDYQKKDVTREQIAMDYAQHLIEKQNIRPVVIDSTTHFYEYDRGRKIWNRIEWEMITKRAKEKLQHFWTRHTKQTFATSMRDNPEYIEWSEMGLQPDLLMIKNGKLLDIQNREIREGSKDDYALNAVKANYNEEAESQYLKEFLEKTFPKEKERKSLQEFIGYTLTFPSDKFEKALLLLGYTDTGKSTFLKVLEEFYGDSSVSSISFPQLGHQRAFHVEKLKESVVNLDHDMSNQNIANYSRIKKLISKESLFADPKGESGYNMESRANFIIASNHPPDDRGADEAFYNRFLTIQAPNRVPAEEQDRKLVDKLTGQEELNWFLNWALEGWERLQEQNHFTVKRKEYDTKKLWTKYGDSVHKFIHSQITRDLENGKHIPTTDIYETYKLWCETELVDPVSRQKFISRAADHPDMEKKNYAF